MTKDELEQQIRALQSQVQALHAQISERDAILTGRPAGAGYLVTTPNTSYTGVTAGVRFVAGQAFLALDDPNSEAMARQLKNDFHYTVEVVGGENGKGKS